MSMRTLEAAILVEARVVTGNKRLRQKDIMEWSSGKIEAQEGETLYKLPKLGVNIAIKVEEKKA